MALLYHWRRENYEADTTEDLPGGDLELVQNSPLIRGARGHRIWAFTRRRDDAYVFAATMLVDMVTEGRHRYGRYLASPEPSSTIWFDVARGRDCEPLIRSLSIRTQAQILGHSFQGNSAVRLLSEADDGLIRVFTITLPRLSP
jgi:hypothetical protein